MIDLSFLQDFTKGDHKRLHRYISMYLQNAPELFQKMATSLQGENWTDLANYAHALRPQAEFMGIVGLKDLLLAIDQRARAGETSELPALVEHALSLHMAAVPELQAFAQQFSEE